MSTFKIGQEVRLRRGGRGRVMTIDGKYARVLVARGFVMATDDDVTEWDVVSSAGECAPTHPLGTWKELGAGGLRAAPRRQRRRHPQPLGELEEELALDALAAPARESTPGPDVDVREAGVGAESAEANRAAIEQRER